MALRRLVKTIRRRWLFILLFVLAVLLLLAAAIWLLMPERYEATATLVVSRTADDLNKETYELDGQLLSTYREMLNNDKLLTDAAQNAGTNLTAKEMRSRVQVSNPRGTNLVNIRVWSNVPEVSANLANAVAVALQESAYTYFQIDNVHLVDYALPPSAPARMHIAVILLAGGGIAFLLAVLISWLREYFDDTLKSVEQVSDLFGRPVLGQIPHSITRLRRQQQDG